MFRKKRGIAKTKIFPIIQEGRISEGTWTLYTLLHKVHKEVGCISIVGGHNFGGPLNDEYFQIIRQHILTLDQDYVAIYVPENFEI